MNAQFKILIRVGIWNANQPNILFYITWRKKVVLWFDVFICVPFCGIVASKWMNRFWFGFFESWLDRVFFHMILENLFSRENIIIYDNLEWMLQHLESAGYPTPNQLYRYCLAIHEDVSHFFPIAYSAYKNATFRKCLSCRYTPITYESTNTLRWIG